jgi:hypothetical protein
MVKYSTDLAIHGMYHTCVALHCPGAELLLFRGEILPRGVLGTKDFVWYYSGIDDPILDQFGESFLSQLFWTRFVYAAILISVGFQALNRIMRSGEGKIREERLTIILDRRGFSIPQIFQHLVCKCIRGIVPLGYRGHVGLPLGQDAFAQQVRAKLLTLQIVSLVSRRWAAGVRECRDDSPLPLPILGQTQSDWSSPGDMRILGRNHGH